MKRLILMFLCTCLLISSLPSFAISQDTHLFPIVGPASEEGIEYLDNQLEKIRIKLPRKIYKFELLEIERTFTPNFVRDHLSIWSSPFRTKYQDLRWLLKAIGHASLLFLAVSRIAGRKKPNSSPRERGEFFEGGTSFPSGHTLNAFASASVLANQYSDKKWVPVLTYSLASLIGGSRITEGLHFPSDVFASAVAGVLIGNYIVKRNSKFAPSVKEEKKNSRQEKSQ